MSVIDKLKDIPEEEYITCQRIVDFCRVLGIPYIKPDPIKYRRQLNARYVQSQFKVSNSGWNGFHDIVELDKMNVIVTGYSDYPIDHMELDLLEQPNLKAWFANNINIRHPKLHAVPLGLPNEVDYAIQGNTRTIYEVAQTPRVIKNLAYMNFKIETFPAERRKVSDMFSGKPWVTKGGLNCDEGGHIQYLKDIQSCFFCICPRGNGFDSHRMMEALYLGTIPVVKRCIAMEQFYDLPCVFIDDWNQVTEEFLKVKYEEIINREYDLSKLYISHWLNRIATCPVE
jgi:hypothetical protein